MHWKNVAKSIAYFGRGNFHHCTPTSVLLRAPRLPRASPQPWAAPAAADQRHGAPQRRRGRARRCGAAWGHDSPRPAPAAPRSTGAAAASPPRPPARPRPRPRLLPGAHPAGPRPAWRWAPPPPPGCLFAAAARGRAGGCCCSPGGSPPAPSGCHSPRLQIATLFHSCGTGWFWFGWGDLQSSHMHTLVAGWSLLPHRLSPEIRIRERPRIESNKSSRCQGFNGRWVAASC